MAGGPLRMALLGGGAKRPESAMVGGSGPLPFGDQIRSVRELMERLLTRSPALAL